MNTLEIDGTHLSIEDLHDVAFEYRSVKVADSARALMNQSRRFVENIVTENRTVYGISTGFGKLSGTKISPDEIKALQRNLVRSHAVGVGDPLSLEEARALMLLRANVLAKGYSGVRPLVVDRLCQMLNAGVHPFVPCRGSVGASGDLAPLAHLALVLIGEGEAFFDSQRVPGGAVMRHHGVEPIELEAKEGLALTNGTQGTLATGVICLRRAQHLMDMADLSAAMSLEALQGTPAAFDSRIHEVRPHNGQMSVARRMLRFLAGSEIRQAHIDCPRVQDAYSLRCIPQIHGPVRDCLQYVRTTVETEMNSATDNPLVFSDGDIISGGNFHGQPLGLAFDFMGIALSELASVSERRIERLLNPEYGNLPPFLSDHPGLHSGFMIAQVTAAALASENKVFSHPASVDSIPTSGNQEDHVAMSMGAALKLKQIVSNLEKIVAIEFLCAAQGLDYLRPLKPGALAENAYQQIRDRITHLSEDRVLSIDIEKMCELMTEPSFIQLAR